MYTVILDGSYLLYPSIEELTLADAELSLEVNKAGHFEFTIYPSHPLYAQIHKLKSIVEVYQDNVRLFRGRVLNSTINFDKSLDVLCEGELAYLNDSVLRPYNFNGSIEDYLSMMITSHNAQVELSKQFTLGNVTVTDPNDYIVRSNINHTKTWEEINNKLLDSLGGYLVIRRVGGVNYLDYLEDSPYMSLQEVELGQNLLDLIQETRADETITALIPLGAKLVDENEEETDERLTIESENGGLDYIYDEDAVAQYGYIFDTVVYDNITLPINLLTRANQELALRVNLGTSVQLRAVDLSMIEDIDEIRIFEYVQVTSQPHDIDTMALITKQELDLLNPANNTLTFGFSYKSFTEKRLESDKAIRKIESDYVTNEQVNEVRNNVNILSSNIEQAAEQIRTEVSETYVSTGSLDEYKNEVSTQFTQTSTDYTYLFNQLETYVQTLDGDTQAQFEEIIKYIRFVDGKIVLGEINNPLTLEIQNDRISFQQSGAEVAYISNNILYITDGHFLTSLRIGNFAFTPRTNGNLSFGKVS